MATPTAVLFFSKKLKPGVREGGGGGLMARLPPAPTLPHTLGFTFFEEQTKKKDSPKSI